MCFTLCASSGWQRPGACIRKQDYSVSWTAALSKTRSHPKSGTWTELKRGAPGFTQCSYPANSLGSSAS
uniref:Uncharacterized protein n=1 Tax=Anguilla anguilla TaxID=7936 RepID=A0A0E9U2P6_ANGAN